MKLKKRKLSKESLKISNLRS